MTQRIQLDEAGQAPRPVNPRRDRNKKRWYMTRKEKITLITLGSVTAVLLIAAIIMISTMFAAPADDGKILKGVFAAGVNLGGMTKEDAAAALEDATANTYTKLDMTVEVLGEKRALAPHKTGARLDIPAVVDAAYNYGRTGSRTEREQAKKDALANSITIDIIPYLSLNKEYIRDEINKLGQMFSTPLEQPKISLTGTKPSMDVAKPDPTVVHQTLSVYVGTAEYILDTNKLYDQVLEYYNTHLFQVVGECKVVAPDSIEEELLTYYTQLYVEPQSAQEIDGEIIPEKYGYGFDLDAAKEEIAQTKYGETAIIEVRYLKPDWTEESITNGRYQDILGDYSSTLGTDEAWNTNATLACQKLNKVELKPGEIFSFNKFLGTLTEADGYVEALAYRGNMPVKVLGGGVTHAASVLYNSVLAAELQILEYHSHPYAVDFIEVGRDVYVDGSKADFRFCNNSLDYIIILAEVIDGEMTIRIEGIDSRDYYVTLNVDKEAVLPGELVNYMLPGNPGGYVDGDVLFDGVNGYDTKVLLTQIHKSTGQVVSEAIVRNSQYAAKDSIVVALKDAPNNPPTPPTGDPGTSEPSTPPAGPDATQPPVPSVTEPPITNGATT